MSIGPKQSSPQKTAASDRIKNKIVDKQDKFLMADVALSADDVMNQFVSLLEAHQDMKTMYGSLNAEKFFPPVLKASLTPFILNRLSIFSQQYPLHYTQDIVCSWLAVLIVRDMKLDAKTAVTVCCAALSRDFGMLYLPEKLLDDATKFGPDDWNAVKTHPILGELATKDVGEMDVDVARAVLEHHERYDGLGYPKGLKGDKISLLGQIVGVADTICAIRFKRFIHTGRNFRDVYAYIQLAANSYSISLNQSTYNILVNSGVESSFVNPFKSIKDLVYHLYVRAAAMNGAIHLLEKLLETLPFFKAGPLRISLAKQTSQVLKMIQQSGILDDKMIAWLNSLDPDSTNINMSELSEIELLQNEMYWHLFRLTDAMQLFHDKEMKRSSPSAQAITMILKYISEKNLPRAAESM